MVHVSSASCLTSACVLGQLKTSHVCWSFADCCGHRHGEGIAGLVSVIKVVEMFRHRTFLPTAGINKPRSFDWAGNRLRLMMECEPFPEGGDPTIISTSSFGIGGSYAHTILEQCQAVDPSPSTELDVDFTGPLILPLSACSVEHFQLYAQKLRSFLEEEEENPGFRLADVCGTMALHRGRSNYRKAIIASSVQGMRKELDALVDSPPISAEGALVEDKSPRVLFTFTGQGAQVRVDIR